FPEASPASPGGVQLAGEAYVYDLATGERVSTLVNSAPAPRDNVGWHVAISGNTAVVGPGMITGARTGPLGPPTCTTPTPAPCAIRLPAPPPQEGTSSAPRRRSGAIPSWWGSQEKQQVCGSGPGWPIFMMPRRAPCSPRSTIPPPSGASGSGSV